MNKHILVTSIPAWSDSTGANTYSAILSEIHGIEIANLYTRADFPDSKICSRYFQILEQNVIKSIFNNKIKTGKELDLNNIDYVGGDKVLKEEKKRYACFTKYRFTPFLLGRELLWKIGKWKSKELDDFLEEFKPDILLFSIESYIYFNRINKYIIEKCKPSLVVGFLWDDNFTYKQSKSLGYIINRFFTRKSVFDLIKKCDKVLSISPKMKKECDFIFGINSTIMTKPVRENIKYDYKLDCSRPIRLIYTGSLVIGRDKTLLHIVNAIKKINTDRQYFFLDIYTTTPLSKKMYTSLNVNGCSCIRGSIPQSQVFIEQKNSDILVFIESFENRIARLSFSTKITDYLSSNRCILAIGPKDISSIEYFTQQDSALVCTSPLEIETIFNELKDNPQLIELYAEKGYSCGIRNHSVETIRDRMKNVLEIENI